MALPRDLLVAVSVLNSDDLTRLRDFAGYDPTLVDMARLDQAIERAVDDRLAFANDFLAFASRLLALSARTDDMEARNALARTYYAAHHAIRAAILFRNRADEYDHRDAIKGFGILVDRNPFLAQKLRDILSPGSKPEEVRGALIGLIDMRHAADYHSYGSKDTKQAVVDFKDEAARAQKWFAPMIGAIERYVKDRRAGLC